MGNLAKDLLQLALESSYNTVADLPLITFRAELTKDTNKLKAGDIVSVSPIQSGGAIRGFNLTKLIPVPKSFIKMSKYKFSDEVDMVILKSGDKSIFTDIQ